MYLSAEQRLAVDQAAEAEGVTMAEIIRRALDVYLSEVAPDPQEALQRTFGAAPKAASVDRDEWDRG